MVIDRGGKLDCRERIFASEHPLPKEFLPCENATLPSLPSDDTLERRLKFPLRSATRANNYPGVKMPYASAGQRYSAKLCKWKAKFGRVEVSDV